MKIRTKLVTPPSLVLLVLLASLLVSACTSSSARRLAWPLAIEAVKRFFEEVRPDLVGFQETLEENDCAPVPRDLRVGFVCEAWSSGAPSVVRQVLGRDYRVACNRGKAKPQDEECRMAQITQIFVVLSDGEPAANGEQNVVLGDVNVDPHRGFSSQPSARHFRRFVGLGGSLGASPSSPPTALVRRAVTRTIPTSTM